MWKKFIDNVPLRRFTVLMGIIGILYAMRSLISIILLTFIFTFLVIQLINFVQRYLKIPSQLIVILVYLLFIGGIYFAVTIYVPKLIIQTEAMARSMLAFYQHPPAGASDFIRYIDRYFGKMDIFQQFKGGFGIALRYLSSIGSMGFTFVMSLLLSFFFTIEKDDIYRFSKGFLHGPFAWLFGDIYHFAKIFVNTFGVVLEAQFVIAVVNTVITTICLAIMGMPQLLSLGIMVFVLSLVPVAGVIISAIPMMFIGYSVGGVKYIIYIIVMLAVVHALEAYVLNPKFMASRTELPMFYTFVVLFVAEHLFGVWGLIVGIPIFTFMLDVLGVKPLHAKGERLKKVRRMDKKNG